MWKRDDNLSNNIIDHLADKVVNISHRNLQIFEA